MIAVVIPFYQRESGALNRALASVQAQKGEGDLRVYIVDDGSPCSPQAEMTGLTEIFRRNVTIVEQANKGPGAARNLALDCLAPDDKIVAFLDSDDEWDPAHIENVRRSFDAGADFYFANYKRESSPRSRFQECGYAPAGPVVVDGMDDLVWLRSEDVAREVVLRSPVGTSTVAARRSRIGDLRFRAEFRTAGEDIIFWRTFLASQPRIVCSRRIEAHYGLGVNVFESRSWGDARAFARLSDQAALQAYLRRNFRFDGEMERASDVFCRKLDREFCANLLAALRRLDLPPGVMGNYMRQRPFALAHLPFALMGMLSDKLESKA
ncbi:MAG TPA: glycosyltransferase [Rhizomicrobium sp.]|jgi:succinoglycan biosynthesis protein ExoW|nr:glycosyltransferase [Rhizomicrobium sp.]